MNREAVYSAFFTLVQGATGFKYFSRRLRLVEEVDGNNMPALFMREISEKVYARSNDAIEALDLYVELYIYVKMKDDKTDPGPIYNPLVDSVTAQMPPDKLPLPETANGSQFNVFWDQALKFEGLTDNKAVVVIPATIRCSYDAG